jgi:hypothetical protein
LTIAIAGPLIIAPTLMQWKPVFHNFSAQKHEWLKTGPQMIFKLGNFAPKKSGNDPGSRQNLPRVMHDAL